MKRIALALLLAFFLPKPGAWAQGPVTIHNATGVLGTYDPDDPDFSQVTIECQAIPGYMPAQTLTLSTHDPADFRKFAPGDILSFHLCVSGASRWVEQATKTGVSPNANSYLLAPMLREEAEHKQRREQEKITAPVRQLAPGDAAPDIALTDQSGHTVHVSDFKGNAVAITFMYTRCSMLTYCPMVSQNFARTQDLMGRLGAGENWRLLSISIDPAHDTPSMLSSYASAMKADAAHWSFATAEEKKVRKFGAGFGLEMQRTGQTINHSLCTVVIDPAGRVQTIRTGNGWTPQDLAADLRAAMRHNPS